MVTVANYELSFQERKKKKQHSHVLHDGCDIDGEIFNRQTQS